eukprot:scaffold111781_cov35-Tisochrysis_lutea.AAC.1
MWSNVYGKGKGFHLLLTCSDTHARFPDTCARLRDVLYGPIEMCGLEWAAKGMKGDSRGRWRAHPVPK